MLFGGAAAALIVIVVVIALIVKGWDVVNEAIVEERLHKFEIQKQRALSDRREKKIRDEKLKKLDKFVFIKYRE